MSSVAGLKDCEFSLPQEYGKALLNCIEALLKGNVESFACLSYMFCISVYLICSDLNGIIFIVKVKSTAWVNLFSWFKTKETSSLLNFIFL